MTDGVIDRTACAGEWQQWDEVWRSIRDTGDGAVLYAPGTPRTLLEFWQRGYFEDLWALVKDRPRDARFLELGSGRGTTSMYLASRQRDVTLVDRAHAGLELAIQNFAAWGLPAPRTVVADARDTGLPSEEYECVYNIGLLEHFADPVPVLREAVRLLRPGGLLFMVIIPEGSPWRSAPIRLALNPIGTAVRLAAALGRRVAARLRRRPAVSVQPTGAGVARDGDMVRTTYSREQYVVWMRGLGVEDVQCVPYNPYFGVYRSAVLERFITVPIYRQHLRLAGLLSTYPLLKSRFASGTCDLLLCRKAEPQPTR